jgi:fatty acid synthase
MLQNEIVLPNGYFETPSPRIDWEQYKLSVPTSPVPLVPRNKECAIVSISSFGFGGAGGHTVLRQEIPRQTGGEVLDEPPYLYIVGGWTSRAAASLAETYAAEYSQSSQRAVSEVMGQRARQMNYRAFAVGSNITTASFSPPRMVHVKRPDAICMIFSGQVCNV